MHKLARYMVGLTLVMGVAACGDQSGSGTGAEAPPAAPATVPVGRDASTPAINPIESLTKVMGTDAISTQAGKVVDGQMTNRGKAGFLLFGPYVSFASGAYTVTTKGRIEQLPTGQKVRLEVVSNKGKARHAQVDIAQVGDLPALDFSLPEAVGDLEFRVFAPAGSNVSVASYEIKKRP